MKGEHRLFNGDNLEVMRKRLSDASVDLVYLDPPFSSGRDYGILFERKSGRRARGDETAFVDTWSWGKEAQAAYDETVRSESRLGRVLEALYALLGSSGIMAYVAMMAPRLRELHRIMKPTASLYLHCDPTASHYLKVLLDAVFEPASFRNEIVWRYRRWPAKSLRFQRMHDVLLFYSARPGNGHTFETLYGYEKLAESTLKTFGTKKQKADFSSGRRKPGVEAGETVGPPLSDVWEISIIAPIGRERTGYPTQKPEALLERVILASSRPGDLVLDPFCGSGTTLSVAKRLGRKTVGIDMNASAIRLARARLDGVEIPTPPRGARA